MKNKWSELKGLQTYNVKFKRRLCYLTEKVECSSLLFWSVLLNLLGSLRVPAAIMAPSIVIGIEEAAGLYYLDSFHFTRSAVSLKRNMGC